jgi:hypothetical protein
LDLAIFALKSKNRGHVVILFQFRGILGYLLKFFRTPYLLALASIYQALGIKINLQKCLLFLTHNPKVVGSNPAPATKYAL